MSEDGAAGDPAPVTARAIVVGHGDLAAGLVSAVAQITGRGERLLPLSNRDLGGEQLEEALRAALGATGARLVFTDLPGGSWTMAARRVLRTDPSLVVVTGANLAMLLDWLGRDGEPTAGGARGAAERGRGAILTVGGDGAD
jgi:PTS system N-acetylgalactosamine-specific IIA component